MKKTDHEKNKALKIVEQMKKGGTPARYAGASGVAPLDRRKQRKLDKAQGLVSFQLKLNEEIIQDVRQPAIAQNIRVHAVVDSLLEAALASHATGTQLHQKN